jgi:hypothetical protein
MRLRRTAPGDEFAIETGAGVAITRYKSPPEYRPSYQGPQWFFDSDERPFSLIVQHRWAGFGIVTGGFRSIGRQRGVVVPWWFLLALTAVPPAAWMTASIRHARRLVNARRGLCPKRGYDLRATPGRCPECGRVAEGTG